MGCYLLQRKEKKGGYDGIDKSQGGCVIPTHFPSQLTSSLCVCKGRFRNWNEIWNNL